MLRSKPPLKRRPVALGAITLAVLAGAAALVAAMASASAMTLRVAKNVHVTNAAEQAFRVKAVDTHEAVAVGPSGFAVYTFQGETTHHLICHKTSRPATNCWAFWPPVSPASSRGLRKPAGIKGRLGTFRNHGVLQLTLSGRPLYYFTPDLQSRKKARAMGDELKTYGSIWHVVTAGSGGKSSAASPAPAAPTTTTTSSSPYSY